MKRVLILGGGGFIGINIARRLIDEGDYTVTLADQAYRGRVEAYFPDPSERERLEVVTADFTDPSSYQLLGSHYDHVYMMAAIVGVNRTLEHPDEVIRVNTALTHYTLDWLSRVDVGRVVFASSSENYAATTDLFNAPVPTAEDVALTISDVKHPRWTYAVTKMLGESAFLHTASKSGFDATVVRYQNAFGPYMGFRHVIPHLVQRFWDRIGDDASATKEAFPIYGAEQTRAFCYVTDSVDGTVRAMETPAAAGEIYHVGNDEEITMETLTRAVGDLLDYEGPYEYAPTYPGSVQRRCPDLTKCRAELGYEPRVHWHEGLKRTVSWYHDFFAAGRRPDDVGFEPPQKFV